MSNYEVKNVEPVAVSNDVQVRVFTLARGDVIPWHYHRESTGHYFVLRGTLYYRDPRSLAWALLQNFGEAAPRLPECYSLAGTMPGVGR
jgi:hypothetical protein